MKLNYFKTLTDFWQDAPDKTGYKHVYAATFGAIVNLLQESQTRSITITYGRLNGLLKLSEEAYSESLKWLDAAGLVVYFKGKGRNAPATIFVNVPEFPLAVVTDSQNQHTGISGGNGGSKGVGTGGGSGVGSQGVGENPPPYPPIEVNNIITNQPAGQQASEATVFSKPKNIVLSEDEESDLLMAYGPERLKRMLLLVSAYKREKGGNLKNSDFTNCVKWAVGALAEIEAKEQANQLPPTKVHSTYPTVHTTSTRPVVKEWT